jgi:hypothetical protein
MLNPKYKNTPIAAIHTKSKIKSLIYANTSINALSSAATPVACDTTGFDVHTPLFGFILVRKSTAHPAKTLLVRTNDKNRIFIIF